MATAHGNEPVHRSSGSLLIRVWCEGGRNEARIIARFLDCGPTDTGIPGGVEYASGIDEIVDAFRRWVTNLASRARDE